jgi:hypothetical protein
MAIVRQLVKKKTIASLKEDDGPKRRVRVEPPSDFELPTEVSEPSNNLGDYTTLLFGEKKIGKTTLAAEFPNAMFLFFEPGGRGLRVYGSAINGWDDARAALKLLRKNKKFQTIVVDTADIAYKLCDEWVCKDMGIKDPGDAPYGLGWRNVRKEFERWITGLAKCGKGLIIISHASEQEVEMAEGDTVSRLSPTMSKQAREIIDGMVDIWAYYGYHGRRRVLVIEGDDRISAGHRLTERFRTKDGERLRSIGMGKSPKEGYANVLAAFKNTYVPPVEPVVAKKKKKVTLGR